MFTSPRASNLIILRWRITDLSVDTERCPLLINHKNYTYWFPAPPSFHPRIHSLPCAALDASSLFSSKNFLQCLANDAYASFSRTSRGASACPVNHLNKSGFSASSTSSNASRNASDVVAGSPISLDAHSPTMMSNSKNPRCFARYSARLTRARCARARARAESIAHDAVARADVTDADVTHAARGRSRSRPRDRPTSIVDANARARRIVAANIARDGPSRATRRRGVRRRSRRGVALGNEWVVFCFTMGPIDRS